MSPSGFDRSYQLLRLPPEFPIVSESPLQDGFERYSENETGYGGGWLLWLWEKCSDRNTGRTVKVERHSAPVSIAALVDYVFR